MSATGTVPEFGWKTTEPECTVNYVVKVMREMAGPIRPGTTVLDLGCGNGYNSGLYASWGAKVIGCDASEAGIRLARSAYPNVRFEVMEIRDDLIARLGVEPFDIVSSTEVVEHLYDPACWAKCCFNALRPGGLLVCSAPYHGFLKNMAISIFNGWDTHFQPWVHGGHIKFWSKRTLTDLLVKTGFVDVRFRGAGRLPYLWKSMLLSARRPGSP